MTVNLANHFNTNYIEEAGRWLSEKSGTDLLMLNEDFTEILLTQKMNELKAIEQLYGEHIYNMNISSTKSMTGHLLGAAAAIEALACIMAITRSTIPPTINVENLDPAIPANLDLTLHTARKRDVSVALSNTFGFGGHNSTVIFRKVAEK